MAIVHGSDPQLVDDRGIGPVPPVGGRVDLVEAQLVDHVLEETESKSGSAVELIEVLCLVG